MPELWDELNEGGAIIDAQIEAAEEAEPETPQERQIARDEETSVESAGGAEASTERAILAVWVDTGARAAHEHQQEAFGGFRTWEGIGEREQDVMRAVTKAALVGSGVLDEIESLRAEVERLEDRLRWFRG